MADVDYLRGQRQAAEADMRRIANEAFDADGQPRYIGSDSSHLLMEYIRAKISLERAQDKLRELGAASAFASSDAQLVDAMLAEGDSPFAGEIDADLSGSDAAHEAEKRIMIAFDSHGKLKFGDEEGFDFTHFVRPMGEFMRHSEGLRGALPGQQSSRGWPPPKEEDDGGRFATGSAREKLNANFFYNRAESYPPSMETAARRHLSDMGFSTNKDAVAAAVSRLKQRMPQFTDAKKFNDYIESGQWVRPELEMTGPEPPFWAFKDMQDDARPLMRRAAQLRVKYTSGDDLPDKIKAALSESGIDDHSPEMVEQAIERAAEGMSMKSPRSIIAFYESDQWTKPREGGKDVFPLAPLPGQIGFDAPLPTRLTPEQEIAVNKGEMLETRRLVQPPEVEPPPPDMPARARGGQAALFEVDDPTRARPDAQEKKPRRRARRSKPMGRTRTGAF